MIIGMVRTAVALELASIAGEKLFSAGRAGFRAFQTARQDRRATYAPQDFTAARGDDIATLMPFRVTVAYRGQSALIAEHEIMAQTADEAADWAQSYYGSLPGELRIVATSVH